MKTLILNGSPRKNGDTVGLINLLGERLSGDVFVFSCYYGNVAACIDCRYCWEKNGCCINDGWQQLDAYIRECDKIIIASTIN